MNAAILEAIKKSAAVPSMPQVVIRFLQVIRNPDFDYDEIVRILSADAGMVSEVLRLANSALFGVSRKVTNLRQALTLLGPRRTRSLVMGRYLVERFGSKTGSFDTTYFWRRSLVNAVLGSRIADDILPTLRDEVFISALLADIGIPILAQALPERYEPIVACYSPHGFYFSADQERQAVDVTHGEVSAMVLAYWGLPDLICQAVNLHHDNQVGDGEEAQRVARILNGSDRIAKLLCEIPDVTAAGKICVEAVNFLGMDLSLAARLLEEIEKDVEELAGVLHIDVLPSSIYALIAKAIQDRLAVST